MTEPAPSVGMDNFGYGGCEAALVTGVCVQAAVGSSHLCRWHLKLTLGIAAPVGREPVTSATRIPKPKPRRS